MRQGKKYEHYQVICISLYNADVESVEQKIAELKRRGMHGMSRSKLIRIALERLSADDLAPPVERKP